MKLRKNAKRMLSILFAVALLITALPMSVFTVSAESYNGTCGDNLTWTFDEASGELVIEGTGEMKDYGYECDYGKCYSPWYSLVSSIKSVVIGNGVTSIGDWAFYECNSLTSITLPDSVTSIGEDAFYECNSLTRITIPTSVTTIDSGAFGSCNSLTSIMIPDSVTSIGDYAFVYCTSLKSIEVNNSNQHYSSDSFGVLYNKDKTKLIQYPIGNERTVFAIPDGVTSIEDYAFSGCYNLTGVTIPDGVISIGYGAFEYCYSLTSIMLPNSVTSIGYRALYYTGYYDDSSNWENDVLYVGNHLIEAETSLSGIYTIKEGTKCIADSAFGSCKRLTGITIPDSVTSIGKSAFDYCTRLTSVTLPDSVTTISESAFSRCETLTSIAIPDGVTSIGSYTFYDCYNLTSIIIPGSVTTIGDCAFNGCNSLTHITIPDSVISIGDSAFEGCENLTSITIPDGVISIGYGAFEYCYSLTSIILPDSVTSIGPCAFNNCTSLISIIIPDGVTEISFWLFRNCTNLANITIPDSVTYIGGGAFEDCHNLTSITIPNSVTYIEGGAFYNCTSLSNIKLPYQLEHISSETFKDCSSLTEVIIPKSVEYIFENAFSGCTAITDVWYGGIRQDIDIHEGNEELETAVWHYEICTESSDGINHSYENHFCVYCNQKEFLIERIELVEDEVFIVENTSGHYDEDYGYYIYELFNYGKIPEFVAILKDGTRINSEWGRVTVDGDNFYLNDNSWEKQFDNEWKSGNTYMVTGSLSMWSDDYADSATVSADFKVTIIESSVESIEIEDVTLIEGTHGDYEDGVYYYNYLDVIATITLKDGTVIEDAEYIEIDDETYWIDDNAWDLQYDEIWTVGNTYEVTGTLLGASDTFNVTIVKPPIESIEINDITILEGSHGSYDGGVFHYSPNINATITLTDGTVLKDSYIEIDDETYWVDNNASELQGESPWTAGNTYEVTGTLLGVSDTFNVTIVESPVESITFEDIILYEGIDSEHDDGGTYYVDSVLSEVLLKDGTYAEIIDGYEILYDGEYYWVDSNSWDLQYDESWTVGNTYEVTGYLLGVSDTFNVTIKEHPIEKLEIVRMPDKTEYLADESVNLKGAIIRVVYADGFREDIVIDEDYTESYNRIFYFERIKRTADLSVWYDDDDDGNQIAEIELFGITCEIPVEFKENPIKNISIREAADKSIVITVYNSDNTSYDMKVLDLPYNWYANDGACYTSVFTDKGQFPAMIFSNGQYFSLGLRIGEEDVLISNSLPSSEWFDVMRYMYCHPMYFYVDYWDTPFNYTGVITSNNIDKIIEMAIEIEGWSFFENEGITTDDTIDWLCDGELIRQTVKKRFAVDDIDLSLSERYDPETDTYLFSQRQMGLGEIMKYCPDEISYSNGVWSVTTAIADWETGEKDVIRLKLNEDLQIISFSLNGNDIENEKTLTSIAVTTAPSKTEYHNGDEFDLTGMVVTATYSDGTSDEITDYTVSGYDSTPGAKIITVTYGEHTATFTVNVLARRGDVNGDGKTNSSDALRILQYSVGKITEIDKAYADANHDGKINASDALIALQISVESYKGDLWFDMEDVVLTSCSVDYNSATELNEEVVFEAYAFTEERSDKSYSADNKLNLVI